MRGVGAPSQGILEALILLFELDDLKTRRYDGIACRHRQCFSPICALRYKVLGKDEVGDSRHTCSIPQHISLDLELRHSLLERRNRRFERVDLFFGDLRAR